MRIPDWAKVTVIIILVVGFFAALIYGIVTDEMSYRKDRAEDLKFRCNELNAEVIDDTWNTGCIKDGKIVWEADE